MAIRSVMRRSNGSGGAAALASDGFDSDTRAAWTYLNGAQSDLVAPSGSLLGKATVNRVVAYPTSLTGRKSGVVKVKLKPVGVAAAGNGMAFAKDGIDRVHMVIDPSVVNQAQIVVRGVVADQQPISGFGAGNFYWLLGGMIGNACWLHVFSDDPEPTGTGTLVSSLTAKLTGADATAVGKGVTKFLGLHLNADTNVLVDEVKVFAEGGHPFDF